MANPYFEFKQFTVYHDKCAMKVGTDGVLLGAWCNTDNAKNVLDIGCGSGLISLMLAQRNSSIVIDAIDIDADAIAQTVENVSHSIFSNRIKSKHVSLQNFEKERTDIYDRIVSNPPFFNRSLKSPDEQRTLARHTDSLYIDELIRISETLLTDDGTLSIIFPYTEKDNLIQTALSSNLYVSRITNIYPTPSSEAKRVLLEFSKNDISCFENDLIIEKSRHVYSHEFTQLVKDFYLKL